METLCIKHRVEKAAEGSYYTIGFDVPPGVQCITVEYTYPKGGSPANVVDLGLQDETGHFLGWSGGARSSVFVSAYDATPGYAPKETAPGQWGILVGAYRIPAEGLTVEYTITFTPQKAEWLFGDLHTHTNASDGQYPLYELAKKAKKLGMDFLGPANHNNYTDNINPPSIPGLTLIPAVEWTHYKGHINLFGAPMPFQNSFVANSEEEMLALLEAAKAAGALVSVNHPKDPGCPYLWQSRDIFDAVEVWNGPMRPANNKAIAWWETLLQDGRRLPLVGGSDYHRTLGPVRLGRPVTAVWAASRSAKDILAAVGAGHSYVTSSVRGPRLSLQYGTAGFGDAVKIVPNQKAEATLRGGLGLQLVAQGSALAKPLLFAKRQGGAVQASFEPENPGYVYLTAVRKIGGISWVRAISNPIYFRDSE